MFLIVCVNLPYRAYFPSVNDYFSLVSAEETVIEVYLIYHCNKSRVLWLYSLFFINSVY